MATKAENNRGTNVQGVWFTKEQHEVVMQAISAALLFGEDASAACTVHMQDAYREHRKVDESVTVFLGAMESAKMSAPAVDLLYRAHYEKCSRGTGIRDKRTGLVSYDLREGM